MTGERGTTEYNLALGEHRARAAKRYLVRLGVPAERITTLSNGEERPKYEGHDESAWAKNRRDISSWCAATWRARCGRLATDVGTLIECRTTLEGQH